MKDKVGWRGEAFNCFSPTRHEDRIKLDGSSFPILEYGKYVGVTKDGVNVAHTLAFRVQKIEPDLQPQIGLRRAHRILTLGFCLIFVRSMPESQESETAQRIVAQVSRSQASYQEGSQ